MYSISTLAVIPCYRGLPEVLNVVQQTLSYVDHVVLIDDCCPDNSGNVVQAEFSSNRLTVIRNSSNLGVGGSTKVGYEFGLNNGADFIVKIDADGQMNPSDIPFLLSYLKDTKSSYVKGNRFFSSTSFQGMPLSRLIGNIGLSFLTKLSTGYWEIFDPTNGYTAITSNALRIINYSQASNRYFFETDMLYLCSLSNLLVTDVNLKCAYGTQTPSNLLVHKQLLPFARRHILLFAKRLLYSYFLMEVNPGTLSIVLGTFSFFVALCVGTWRYIYGLVTGIETQTGIQTLFLLFALLSIQCMLSFLYYDASTRPFLRGIRQTRSFH